LAPINEKSKPLPQREGGAGVDDGRTGRGLSSEEACQLFSMVFGSDVSKGILAQWSNQGIRYGMRATEMC